MVCLPIRPFFSLLHTHFSYVYLHLFLENVHVEEIKDAHPFLTYNWRSTFIRSFIIITGARSLIHAINSFIRQRL